MTPPKLYLASSSPRRRQILDTLGLTFAVRRVSIDETRHPHEEPAAMVLRLAAEKAAAASVDGDFVVLGADTAVVLDGAVRGKPRGCDDGVNMLLDLAGRTHRVLTGVALRTKTTTVTALSDSEVRFRDIERDEAVQYWQSGEPRDKAGGYGIQGLGGMFVAAIAGSYSGVMGLPVFETVALLETAGIHVLKIRLKER